jgi:hypothetical protein
MFYLFQAPEIDGAIQVGIKRLKEEAPAQAPTAQTRADGAMELKTAGDFFYIAEREARVMMGATLWLTLATTGTLAIALVLSRKKTPAQLTAV